MFRTPPPSFTDATPEDFTAAWSSSSCLLALERGDPASLPLRAVVYAGVAASGLVRRLALVPGGARVLWEYGVSELLVEAGAIARIDDTICLATEAGLACIDVVTGASRWVHRCGPLAEAPRDLGGDAIAVKIGGELYAVSKADGRRLEARVPPATTSSVFAAGHFFDDAGSGIHVFDERSVYVTSIGVPGWSTYNLVSCGRSVVAPLTRDADDQLGVAIIDARTLELVHLPLCACTSTFASAVQLDELAVVTAHCPHAWVVDAEARRVLACFGSPAVQWVGSLAGWQMPI